MTALDSKIERAIQLLRDNEPKDGKGYGLAFSGGKDSIVIKQLAIESGVKFKAFYSVTTLDPPELVRYIKEYHKDVEWLRQPKGLMQSMIELGQPPTMLIRWCCAKYKEQSIKGYESIIIGVRAAESVRRKNNWKEVATTHKGEKRICPIYAWEDDEIWEFIRDRNLPYSELYNQGFDRLGCIGCPFLSKKKLDQQLKVFPLYEKLWRVSFQKMWKKWHNVKLKPWHNLPERYHHAHLYKSGDEWFEKWKSKKNHNDWIQETCQMELMFVGMQEIEETQKENQ